jgi:segregation and condensation protein A
MTIDNVEPFEDPRSTGALPTAELVVDLEGFEGPLDLLLSLAREQKLDITKISILALANQYLVWVAEMRRANLELAADYLVMAAWLAYIKSRLLLPDTHDEEEPSGEEMAAALAFQLRRLEAIQEAGDRLMARARLGRDFFARGEPEAFAIVTTSIFDVSLYDLLSAYGEHTTRNDERTLRILPSEIYSPEDALQRLRKVVGNLPDWADLQQFLPHDLRSQSGDDLVRRSALASTFVAALELTKEGKLHIRQSQRFGPIYIRSRNGRGEQNS